MYELSTSCGVFWPEYSYISKRVKKTGLPMNPDMRLREKFLSIMWYKLCMGVNEMRVKILPLLCRLGLVLGLWSV